MQEVGEKTDMVDKINDWILQKLEFQENYLNEKLNSNPESDSQSYDKVLKDKSKNFLRISIILVSTYYNEEVKIAIGKIE